METLTGQFAAIGTAGTLSIRPGESVSLSFTFSSTGTVYFEELHGNNAGVPLQTYTGTGTGTFVSDTGGRYRLRCVAIAEAATIDYTVTQQDDEIIAWRTREGIAPLRVREEGIDFTMARSGTSSARTSTDQANKNFLQMYCQSTATSAGSDTRTAYLRLYLGAATTGGGEAVRAFTTVNANIGTARGIHASLNFDATAGGSETSGLGTALTGTLHIPDIASWAPTGTYAAGDFEIYSDGEASDPNGMTELAVLRLSNSGNATGKADVDDDAFILSVQGFTAAAGTDHAVSSTSLNELPAGSVGLRVKIGSNTYYIPAVAAAEWN